MSDRYIIRKWHTQYGVRYGIFDTTSRGWPRWVHGHDTSALVVDPKELESTCKAINVEWGKVR
jgi:hypothetical protein